MKSDKPSNNVSSRTVINSRGLIVVEIIQMVLVPSLEMQRKWVEIEISSKCRTLQPIHDIFSQRKYFFSNNYSCFARQMHFKRHIWIWLLDPTNCKHAHVLLNTLLYDNISLDSLSHISVFVCLLQLEKAFQSYIHSTHVTIILTSYSMRNSYRTHFTQTYAYSCMAVCLFIFHLLNWTVVWPYDTLLDSWM